MNKVKTIVTRILLLALMVLGTAMAEGALAAERGPASAPAGAGLQSNHISDFGRPLDRGPATTPPVFNQSNPYTTPQSPERPCPPGVRDRYLAITDGTRHRYQALLTGNPQVNKPTSFSTSPL